jgi:hypothetical protein
VPDRDGSSILSPPAYAADEKPSTPETPLLSALPLQQHAIGPKRRLLLSQHCIQVDLCCLLSRGCVSMVCHVNALTMLGVDNVTGDLSWSYP